MYDVRMSPQAVWHDDTIFIVYHATGDRPGAAPARPPVCDHRRAGPALQQPKPVERADGSEVARALTLFGWDGPPGLAQAQRPYAALGSSAGAYLWIDGEWR